MAKFRRLIIAVLSGCLVLSVVSFLAQAQEMKAPSSERGAAAAFALDAHQEALGGLLGMWDVDMVLSTGATPAQHSKGKAEYSWIIKGRWLGCHVIGEMLGLPYEQFTILGYDGYAKNIVEVSVESVDNSMLLSRGAFPNPNQSTIALFGDLDEYTTGVLHRPYKVVMSS